MGVNPSPVRRWRERRSSVALSSGAYRRVGALGRVAKRTETKRRIETKKPVKSALMGRKRLVSCGAIVPRYTSPLPLQSYPSTGSGRRSTGACPATTEGFPPTCTRHCQNRRGWPKANLSTYSHNIGCRDTVEDRASTFRLYRNRGGRRSSGGLSSALSDFSKVLDRPYFWPHVLSSHENTSVNYSIGKLFCPVYAAA